MARAKWMGLGIVGALALASGGMVAAGGLPLASGIEQPIAFPHDVHAGENQVPCMYCHFSADRSPDAGIPSVQVCAGCHVPAGVPMIAADSPGVQKLIGYWERREPIPWVRIYDLPDHVHFPHMMHVDAGVQCQQCHGPVETMRLVEQYASLEMGWCIDCHKQREVRIDCSVCHY